MNDCHDLSRFHLWADRLERNDPRRQPRAGVGIHVASVERVARLAPGATVLRLVDLAYGIDAHFLGHHRQRAVVGRDDVLAGFQVRDDRFARRTHARVNHGN